MASRTPPARKRMVGRTAARRRRARAAQDSPPNQSDDVKKNRRVRRRNKRENKANKEPAKRYDVLFRFPYYDLERAVKSGVKYIGWYDESARQKRRRSLQTTDDIAAFETVSRIDASGATGDPILLLHQKVTIDTVLQDYQTHHEDDPSAGFNRTAIGKHLSPALGAVVVDRWRDEDFKTFKDEFLKRGGSRSYLSRLLTVLRAALNEAETRTKKIARAPFIPEVMSEEDRDQAPLKGRLMTVREIARLIDAVRDEHLLQYLIGEINTGSRPITTLESDTSRINWQDRLFETNPRGRSQTKKFRPLLRIPATWEPWLRAAPPGLLVTYDGTPIKSIKKAFAAARKAADLKPDAAGVPVTSYSIRHSLGRFLEDCNVPEVERALLLGHVKPKRKKITSRYSPTNPRNPHYLEQAVTAIERFVHEINSHTKKWNLLVPFAVKPGYPETKQDDGRISRIRAKSGKHGEAR